MDNFILIFYKKKSSIVVPVTDEGDFVGIKGRIESRTIDLDEEHKKNVVELIAEKVTFLSSKPKEEE